MKSWFQHLLIGADGDIMLREMTADHLLEFLKEIGEGRRPRNPRLGGTIGLGNVDSTLAFPSSSFLSQNLKK